MRAQEGTNEARRTGLHPALALPYGVGFASAEKRLCADIQATGYDVLCWHTGPGLTTHWVNGSIARQFNMRTASEFAAPYTPIRWR